ncbi:hypothetical protein Ddc_10929 [Ditylenchus destructor]|nr:hypothetical protein Ddc_10929 [Ditylenchus destructor]
MHTHLISNVPVHYDGNTISHAGSYGKTRLNSHTHGTMGQVDQFYPPSGYQTSVPVVQNFTYSAPGLSVNHAGPSMQVHAGANEIIEKRAQNIQLDPAVQKDIKIKDTTREGSNKRQNSPKDVNKTAKRSISADPFKRLAIKLHTEELCKILNTFGMKMDTGYECDYGNNPPDKRCECSRSLGLPDTDAVTRKITLRNTMMDGPHHFANWMCHNGLHPDIFALENPMKVLSRKSICAAGRFYQSRDLKEYFEAESKKEGGKYVELKKSELRSGVNYFICCKRKDQQYWQIYYGTDALCVAGYGPYPDYDERKYFFNKEFHQQRKDQTSSGK